jgi:hypothetical protein
MYKVYITQKVRGLREYEKKTRIYICVGACETYELAKDLVKNIQNTIFEGADEIPTAFKLVIEEATKVKYSRAEWWDFVELNCCANVIPDSSTDKKTLWDAFFKHHYCFDEYLHTDELAERLKYFAKLKEDETLKKNTIVYDLDECEYVLDIVSWGKSDDHYGGTSSFILIPYTDEWKEYRKANGLIE